MSSATNILSQMKDAARIMLAVKPNSSFTLSVALYCAGVSAEDATNADVIEQTRTIVQSLQHEIVHYATAKNKRERAMILVCLAKRLPNIKFYSKKKGIEIDLRGDLKLSDTLTNTCRWAGFHDDELKRGNRKCYQTVFNFKKAFSENKIDSVTSTSHPEDTNSRIATLLEPERPPVRVVDVLTSPDADVQSCQSYSLVSPTRERESVASSALTSSTRESVASGALTSSACSSSLSSLSMSICGGKEKRKTSSQKQHERVNKELWDRSHRCAFKLATTLYNQVKEKENPILKFKDPNAVADLFNDGFVNGLPLLSGREVVEGVSRGLAGKSPPRKGRPTLVSSDDTNDLAALVFSASAIEQANCSANRLSRTELASLVGDIVNDKRKSEGKEEIHDITLFERIQKINSIGCNVQAPDKREMLRSMWLTVDQQKKHYINWEQALIELEFGRAPNDEREQKEKGFVIIFDGQENRVVHLDEMGFLFDGSKNGIGGRPGTVFSLENISDGGCPTQKSSDRITILCAATFGGEALPPLIVIPSSAKNPSLAHQLIQHLHQVGGKWGYNRKMFFNCHIGK